MSGRSPRLAVAAAMGVAAVTGSVLGLRHAHHGSAASLAVTSRALGGLTGCVLTGFPKEATVADDTYGNEKNPADNYATKNELIVDGKPAERVRSFVWFDLTRCTPAIPSGATVTAATLRLYVTTTPSATRTYEVRRIVAPCPEGAARCWTETGLTWSNQPARASSATAAATIGTGGSANNQYYRWDVTPDVAAFVAGSAPNQGWVVRDSAEGTDVSVKFASTEAEKDNGAGAPQLTVIWSR